MITIETALPPKPIELLMANLILEVLLVVTINGAFSRSLFCPTILGGSLCLWIANATIIASKTPAPPKVCPICAHPQSYFELEKEKAEKKYQKLLRKYTYSTEEYEEYKDKCDYENKYDCKIELDEKYLVYEDDAIDDEDDDDEW